MKKGNELFLQTFWVILTILTKTHDTYVVFDRLQGRTGGS